MSFNLSDSLDTVVSAGNALSFPTGLVLPFFDSTAPDSWVIVTGGSAIRTLGNGSSGADRANTDTEDLFTMLWNAMGDSEAPVSSGRGASAAADFAANKTITMPEVRGRSIIGSGTGGGLTARTLGDTGGAETHQLTEDELAAHIHTTPSLYGLSGTSLIQSGSSYVTQEITQTNSTGSDTAHANMQPWTALSLICKL